MLEGLWISPPCSAKFPRSPGHITFFPFLQSNQWLNITAAVTWVASASYSVRGSDAYQFTCADTTGNTQDRLPGDSVTWTPFLAD